MIKEEDEHEVDDEIPSKKSDAFLTAQGLGSGSQQAAKISSKTLIVYKTNSMEVVDSTHGTLKILDEQDKKPKPIVSNLRIVEAELSLEDSVSHDLAH